MTAGDIRKLLKGLPASQKIQFSVYLPEGLFYLGIQESIHITLDGAAELDDEITTLFSIRLSAEPEGVIKDEK